MDLTRGDFWLWCIDLLVLNMGIGTLTTSCLAALTKLTGLSAWYAITNLCRTCWFTFITSMSCMTVEVSTSNRVSSVEDFTFVIFASNDTRGLFSLARESTKRFLTNQSKEILHDQWFMLLSVLPKSDVDVGLVVTNVHYFITKSSNIHWRIVKTWITNLKIVFAHGMVVLIIINHFKHWWFNDGDILAC